MNPRPEFLFAAITREVRIAYWRIVHYHYGLQLAGGDAKRRIRDATGISRKNVRLLLSKRHTVRA